MKNLIFVSVLTAAGMSMAGGPVKYPACAKNTHLTSVPNGAGVYFNETCEIGYVLPPAKGQYEISGLTPNTNLGMCPGYENTQKSLNSMYARLNKITKKMEGMKKSSGQSELGGGDSLDGDDSSDSEDIQPIDPKLVTEMNSTLDAIDKLKTVLKSFDDDKKGVAVAKISYYTNWNALVEDYQKANPRLHFERLPLEAGRIVFGRKVGAAGEVVNGAVAHTIHGIENTTGVSADGTLNSSSGAVIMGDAISGQIVLNLAGACPFVKNGKLPSDLSKSEMENYLAANFEYKYSLQSLRKYKATYNLKSVAKHIQETHKSGGFFSSSTSSSIINSNSYNDEFSMEIESDQTSYEFDDRLRAEVKTELINRVLSGLALRTGQNIGAPVLIPPSAHGASVAADELQKVPNTYAQIGAMSLRVLESIFGNSAAVAQYIEELDGQSKETVSEKRTFTYNGSTLFKTGK